MVKRSGIYLKTLDDSQLEGLFLGSRSHVLGAVGRDGEALASYDRAIAIGPNHADTHLNRGVVLEEFGRYREALEAFERACRLNPELLYLISRDRLLKLRILSYWDL